MPLRQNQLQSTPQQISADTKIPDMEKIWNDLGNSEANQARIARNSFPRHCLVKSAPPICKVRYIRKAHAQVPISTLVGMAKPTYLQPKEPFTWEKMFSKL